MKIHYTKTLKFLGVICHFIPLLSGLCAWGTQIDFHLPNYLARAETVCNFLAKVLLKENFAKTHAE